MALFKKDPWIITVYRTYGTVNHLYIKGRALEDERIRIHKGQSFFRTIRNTWNQFFTDEIKNVPIEVELPDGSIIRKQTDNEGYFEVDRDLPLDARSMTDEDGFMKFKVRFVKDKTNKKHKRIRESSFPGELLIPPLTAKFGVISDIDDTILHTGVTSFIKWKLIYNSFFKSVHKRSALEGTADFYTALHEGKDDIQQNPFFYISNSPWNLYGYLEVFLRYNKFPKGPILLRDLRFPWSKKPRIKEHKPHTIENVLTHYPKMNFVLIGDGGEHDLDLYLEAAEKFPDRILAIYIRGVKHKRKMRRLKAILDNYQESVPVLIVENSAQLHKHAEGLGLI